MLLEDIYVRVGDAKLYDGRVRSLSIGRLFIALLTTHMEQSVLRTKRCAAILPLYKRLLDLRAQDSPIAVPP